MTRSPSPDRDPGPEPHPLPASLTRFLSDPRADIVAPSHEDRARRARPTPSTPNVALRLAIGWAVFYNVAGFAILWWLWSTMG